MYCGDLADLHLWTVRVNDQIVTNIKDDGAPNLLLLATTQKPII